MTIDRQAPAWAEHRITIQAPIEKIFALLTAVQAWPDWNPAVKNVRVDRTLAPGVTFYWKSGGISIASTVQQLDAPRFIGWTGKAIGTRAIHTWTLEPTANGVVVTTAESFDGWLVRLMKKAMQTTLDDALQSTLQKLKVAAERA
jgi:uncharacterized protein YndB with AHSA1/START domain